MADYILAIGLDIVFVLFSYFAIGKIAERKLEMVRRCEDAEPILEWRLHMRFTLCVIGFLFLLCMLRAIIHG